MPPNYFAQADDGTVWYFGEVVDEYEDGVVAAHGGSWLVGGPGPDDPAETVTADEPTVFMPGNPEVGDEWKAEDLPEAGIEEFDEVVRILRHLRVPAGRFCDVLQVREETPDVGYKWYAPGVGFVKEKDADEAVALVEILDNDDADAMEERLEEVLEDLLCEDEESGDAADEESEDDESEADDDGCAD